MNQFRMIRALRTATLAVAMALAVPAHAVERGPVTNLPLPRYVSIKASEANVRRGPSLTHRIDWVFQRRNLPVEITAEFGHWRRIRDAEGAGGWIHYSLLSGTRTVLLTADATLRKLPRDDALPVARAEAGVVATLGDCEPEWCRVTARRLSGWVPKSGLWGVADDEVRD